MEPKEFKLCQGYTNRMCSACNDELYRVNGDCSKCEYNLGTCDTCCNYNSEVCAQENKVYRCSGFRGKECAECENGNAEKERDCIHCVFNLGCINCIDCQSCIDYAIYFHRKI